MHSYTKVQSYPFDDNPDKEDKDDKEDGREDMKYKPAP